MHTVLTQYLNIGKVFLTFSYKALVCIRNKNTLHILTNHLRNNIN